jgi:penicillin-binding protein 2
MKIAAKTGTAQVGSKEHRRQIAWLSGYLPADNPQYSFSVMVEGRFSDNRDDTEEGGLLGGREAGQIVHDMLDIVYPVPGKKGKLADESGETKSDSDTASSDKSANEDTGQASTASTDDSSTNVSPRADRPPAPTTAPAPSASAQ